MKHEFSNKRVQDLRTQVNRLTDFKGSFDKIEKTTSSGTRILTFSFVGAMDFSILTAEYVYGEKQM
jgi:hypothetical protein